MAPYLEEQGFTIGEDIYPRPLSGTRAAQARSWKELIYNNRIIGGMTPACVEAGKKVYGTFVKGEMIETNAKTAEMSKLMENTYRDVNIALANELAKICNHLDINVHEVIGDGEQASTCKSAHPGPGVGGHCLAVDPYFIIAEAPSSPIDSKGARDQQFHAGICRRCIRRKLLPSLMAGRSLSSASRYKGRCLMISGNLRHSTSMNRSGKRKTSTSWPMTRTSRWIGWKKM